MNREIYLKKMEERAVAVFDQLSIKRGWAYRWNFYKKNNQPNFKLNVNNNNIIFTPLGDKEIEKKCSLKFGNIRPIAPKNISYSPAELLDEKINDVRLEEIFNPMKNGIITKTYTRAVSNSVTEITRHLAGVEATIQQTISYGVPTAPVRGETKFGLALKYEFTKQNETTDTTTTQTTTQIEVPAGEKVEVVIRNSVGKYSQYVEMLCDFEHSITYKNDSRDVNTNGTWDSLIALKNSLRGIGDSSHPERPKNTAVWSLDRCEKTFPPLNIKYSEKFEFDKTSKGTTVVKNL